MAKTKIKKVTKRTLISEIMHQNPKAAETLMEEGMMCMGCPHAMQETLEQACQTHGLDTEKLLKKLNKLNKTKIKSGK
jgi:hybrid cluster-associated redox disulfide protein